MKKIVYIVISVLLIIFMLNVTTVNAIDDQVWNDHLEYIPIKPKGTQSKGNSNNGSDNKESDNKESKSSGSSKELKGTGTGGSSDLNLDALENEINNVKGGDAVDAVNKVLGVASIFIVSAAVIVVIMKGVSFMQAAPEGKAEIQKQMINIVVGGVILFGINGIVGIIINVASKMF